MCKEIANIAYVSENMFFCHIIQLRGKGMMKKEDALRELGLSDNLTIDEMTDRTRAIENNLKKIHDRMNRYNPTYIKPQPLEEWLTYDKVSLIPREVSEFKHRSEANTSVQFGPFLLDVPLIAAPMPDVCGVDMCNTLAGLGSLGIYHRFNTTEPSELLQMGVAIGLKEFDRVDLLYDLGYRVFCIDTANGANTMVRDLVVSLKTEYPGIFIISGNVASGESFAAMQSWGVDAIRVGIAGGSVCETRTETGVYSPMASVIRDCNSFKSNSLLIADGGIKSPSDVAKALALGADVVMVGGVFAGTKESPGNVIVVDGKKYKILRGAASFGVQAAVGVKPEYVEGAETLVPYKGSVMDVVDRYRRGLQSSLSYMNARTLSEFRVNAKVVRIG